MTEINLEDARNVAKPIPELNMYIIIEYYTGLLGALQKFTEMDSMGASMGQYQIKSRLTTLYMYCSAMIKRSDEELYDKLKHMLFEEKKVQMDDLRKAIFEVGELLDKKNITKVDMRTARDKRGIEQSNRARGYD